MEIVYKVPKGQNVATTQGWKHIDTVIKDFVYKTDEIPKTFEEIKQLCKDYDYIGNGLIVYDDYIEMVGVLIYSNMLFCKDGAIFLNTDCIFAQNVPMPRIWQIIKGFMGE